MLKTTVTPRASTRAKPRWSSITRWKRSLSRLVITSDPGAVPQEDGVGEVVGSDARPSHAHVEIDLKRREAETARNVRERWKDVVARQIVGHHHPGRVARGPRLPVQPVALRVTRDRRGAPADVAAAARRDLQRHSRRRKRGDVAGAVDVAPDLVERQAGGHLRLETALLIRLRLRAGDEDGRDACEDN